VSNDSGIRVDVKLTTLREIFGLIDQHMLSKTELLIRLFQDLQFFTPADFCEFCHNPGGNVVLKLVREKPGYSRIKSPLTCVFELIAAVPFSTGFPI
jgi:hypothetical protein